MRSLWLGILACAAMLVACGDDDSDFATRPSDDSSSSVCKDCDDGSSSALSGHFVQSGGLSKKSRFRKPLGNCKFTTQSMFLR